MLGVVHESGNGRLCCKTLFGSLKTNFPGCGRGDRIIVCGPQQLVMNSPATSVARLRAIVAWLLSSRENRRKAIFGVCNTICHNRTSRSPSDEGSISL